MDLNQARTIYQGIQDSKLTNLADELVRAAVRYARLRTDWALSTTERRLEMDPERTRAHNALIDCCNILSRNMRTAGEDNSWRVALGDDRKAIGDFACLLHCLLGISAR